MEELITEWPDDADGDVFCRLADSGFDFSRHWAVDYNVDFDSWPPPEPALELLRSMFGSLAVNPPEHDAAGYAHFQVFGSVTYETVTSVQRRATAAMKSFGGVCESWGVLHGVSL